MGTARLRDTRLFKDLPPAVLAELAGCMQDSEVSKGDILFEAIDDKSPMVLILLGIVDLKLNATTSSAFRANDILGLHHYIYGQELRVEAVVRVPSTILTIARADLDRLTAKHQPLKEAVALYRASTSPDPAASDQVRLAWFPPFVSPPPFASPLNGPPAPNGNVPPPPSGWPPDLLRRLLAPQVPPEAQGPQGGSPEGGDKPPSPSFARFSLHHGLTRGLSFMRSAKKLQRLSMASRGSVCRRSGEGDDAPGGAKRRAQRDRASGASGASGELRGASGEPPPTAQPKRLRFFEDNTLGRAQEKAQETHIRQESQAKPKDLAAQVDLGLRQDSSSSLAGVAGALREQKPVPNPARSRRASTINRSLRFAESHVQDLDSGGEMRGLSLRCTKPRLKQCLHGYPSLADYGWKAEPEVEVPRSDAGWIKLMARGAIQTSKQARILGQFMPFATGADLPPTETQKLYRHIANLLDDLQLHSDETQGLRSRENLEEQLHEHVEDAHGNGGNGKVRRVRVLLHSCPAPLLRYPLVCPELLSVTQRLSSATARRPLWMCTGGVHHALPPAPPISPIPHLPHLPHLSLPPAPSPAPPISLPQNAAIMIWLGIGLDGIPESFVLGILANARDMPSLITFVVGVFLANLPEAMSSSAIMSSYGMKSRVIMLMWTAIFIGTGIGAGLGALAFPPVGPEGRSDGIKMTIAGIEGMCGGAMLTMIASTVLPEAFEHGGSMIGVACLFGFLAALLTKAIGSELSSA